MDRYIGLDFGTTNSSLAACGPRGEPELARFATRDGAGTSTFRSVLFFDPEERDPKYGVRPVAGPEALARYLVTDGRGRLVQSLKSYLASSLFQSTQVFGRTWRLEEMVSMILRGLRESSPDWLESPARVVVGRPVRYVNADAEGDEALALGRLREALTLAGFGEVTFELEPVGAAWLYESSLDHDELVMIGDFGGGTSDFCLMRVGPGARGLTSAQRILGTEGVGLAGDAFDSEIVQHEVSPRLGLGSSYRSYLDGKELLIPSWVYTRLRRWHHLSFLKSADTMRFLRDMHAQAIYPERIEALIHLVDHDLGFALHRQVEGAKVRLSSQTSARLHLDDGPLVIDAEILRAAFTSWIVDELTAIEKCIAALLEKTGVKPGDVDRVFLTGGSSLVPAVRAVFAGRFGEEKIRTGDALTSVALGLSLRARALG